MTSASSSGSPPPDSPADEASPGVQQAPAAHDAGGQTVQTTDRIGAFGLPSGSSEQSESPQAVAHTADQATDAHEAEEVEEAEDEIEESEASGVLPSDNSQAEVGSLEAPPPQVAELVAACMRFVASKYKVALDGTADTLSLVDQYVREARAAFIDRPESIDLVAPAVGAYLGEVIRHAFGAEWFCEGAHDAWRIYCRHVYLSLNPIGVAREAITMSEQPGWSAHVALDPAERPLIEERLAVMPDVDEDEYFLPSTRFDTLAVIVDTLRAHAESAGTGDIEFTREDYA